MDNCRCLITDISRLSFRTHMLLQLLCLASFCPPNPWASGVPDSKAAKIQTARFHSFPRTMFHRFQIARLERFPIARFQVPKCKVAKFPNSQVANVPNSQVEHIPTRKIQGSHFFVGFGRLGCM